MKAGQFSQVVGCRRAALAWLFTLAAVLTVSAQPSPGHVPVPTVYIYATTPIVKVSGGAGQFAVVRQGTTNLALNLYYTIAGTAANGTDYERLSNWVTIPAGAVTNAITITPINHGQTNIGTVLLQLAPSPLATPGNNYIIGSPPSATVYIEGNGVTNLPPLVSISSPTNGETLVAPANLFILAPAGDLDGWVPTVKFFAGTTLLGVFTNPPPPLPGQPVPNIVILPQHYWTNVPAGNYVLTAVATDNDGATTTSAPVNITVTPSLPPPPAPVVAILAPTNGASYLAPSSLDLLAKASETNGAIARVSFFAGTNNLGQGGLVVLDPPGIGGETGPVYLLSWFNPQPGGYALTAVAADSHGVTATSAPVSVSIQPLPPTNPPPTIRIISPANGSVLATPVNLPLFAFAADTGANSSNSLVTVGFFAGTNFLGQGQPVPLPVPTNPYAPTNAAAPGEPLIPPQFSTNIYSLVWSNAPAGTYALTATATVSGGNVPASTATSAPVNVTILAPPPPPTNRPLTVSIVATDPVAVAGTNSWTWLGETNATPTWTAWPGAANQPFTNSGPKTASFTVRLAGQTNGNLTVSYAIGGTATNGVDYAALPSFVTIPAGARSALITVVPVDAGATNVNKTVVLTLTTNADYTVGFPRSAAALIIDSNGPRPATGLTPGRYFHLTATGPDSAWYCVETSSNLLDWTAVCTNQAVNGSIDYVDPNSPAKGAYYYRAVPLTSGN